MGSTAAQSTLVRLYLMPALRARLMPCGENASAEPARSLIPIGTAGSSAATFCKSRGTLALGVGVKEDARRELIPALGTTRLNPSTHQLKRIQPSFERIGRRV